MVISNSNVIRSESKSVRNSRMSSSYLLERNDVRDKISRIYRVEGRQDLANKKKLTRQLFKNSFFFIIDVAVTVFSLIVTGLKY